MQELIAIQTGGQGSPVVSARELHTFLESGKDFSNWIKHRIKKYGLVENQDYVIFAQTGENPTVGRPTTEYALTLDAAKELAMVEGTAKGKQARQYFIDAEKALRQLVEAPAPILTTEQMLLQLAQQQTQLLTNQQEQIEQLRADMARIQTTDRKSLPAQTARRVPGKQLGLPGIPLSPPSMRQAIHQRVNAYSDHWGSIPKDTYIYLYKRLFDVYGISTHRLMRGGTESLLDAIDRYGHLDKLYHLVINELVLPDEDHA